MSVQKILALKVVGGRRIPLLIVFHGFPISTFADATRYHSCVYALLESKVYYDFYNDDDDDGDDVAKIMM